MALSSVSIVSINKSSQNISYFSWYTRNSFSLKDKKSNSAQKKENPIVVTMAHFGGQNKNCVGLPLRFVKSKSFRVITFENCLFLKYDLWNVLCQLTFQMILPDYYWKLFVSQMWHHVGKQTLMPICYNTEIKVFSTINYVL